MYHDIDYVGVVSRCTAQLMARAGIELKVSTHYMTDDKIFSLYGSWQVLCGPCICYHACQLNCYHVIFGDSVTDLMTGEALHKD